jgi:hypothetical protein
MRMKTVNFTIPFMLFFCAMILGFGGYIAGKIDNMVETYAAQHVTSVCVAELTSSQRELNSCNEAVRNREAQFYTFIERED